MDWPPRNKQQNRSIVKSKSLHQLTKLLMNQSRDFDI